MTSSPGKPATPGPARLIDPNDRLHASIEKLFKGMSPEEKARAKIEFVQSLKAKRQQPPGK